MQIKTIFRFQLTPLRITKINKTNYNLCCLESGVMGRVISCLWESKFIQSLWKSVWGFPRKIRINQSQVPAISFMRIYPKGLYPTMKTLAPFTTNRNWKQGRCSATYERI